jgi:hypothetical protein
MFVTGGGGSKSEGTGSHAGFRRDVLAFDIVQCEPTVFFHHAKSDILKPTNEIRFGGKCVMPQPHSFDPLRPPIGLRRCPKCGVRMFLSCLEPTDQAGQDQLTFECTTCAYTETTTVEFR